MTLGAASCGGPVEPPKKPVTGWVWFKGRVVGDATTLASQWVVYPCLAEPAAKPCSQPLLANADGTFTTFLEVEPYLEKADVNLLARAEMGGVIQTRLLLFREARLVPVGAAGVVPDTLEALFTEDTIVSGN